MIFDYEYITKEELAGFDQYKYSAVDTSPVSKYITHPFWNWFLKFIPKWMAPNLLTFTGFLMAVANFAILSGLDYSFYASNDRYTAYPPIPLWVWFVCSFFHFMAHTLDGVDGKQARRTNSSSPLGELFDHGLDSWQTLFLPVSVYSMFGRGHVGASVIEVYFAEWVILFCFIITHWEKYNTGILFLPWGYDICELLVAGMYIVTGIVGHNIWSVPILGLNGPILFQVAIYAGFLFMTSPQSLYNIYISYRDGSGKKLSLYEGTRPLYSTLLLMFLCTVWVLFSPSNILESQPRIFYIMMGTLFSNIACHLIISQMSNTRCSVSNWVLTPVAICATLSVTCNIAAYEHYLLFTTTAIVILAHLHYGICVVRQMCRHLHIYCFTLRKPNFD